MDYGPPDEDLLTLAGEALGASLRIAIIDDADVERSERFTVTLTDVDGTGFGLTDSVATVTIKPGSLSGSISRTPLQV